MSPTIDSAPNKLGARPAPARVSEESETPPVLAEMEEWALEESATEEVLALAKAATEDMLALAKAADSSVWFGERETDTEAPLRR